MKRLNHIAALVCAASTALMSPYVSASTTYLAGDAGSHAFWLPGYNANTPGTNYRWNNPPQATLTVDTSDWSTANTAQLLGQIKSDTDPASVWDVDINFKNGQTFNDWVTVGGNGFKNENNTPMADVMNWRFFELDVPATLTHVSGPGGVVSPLHLDFVDQTLIFQVGIGASMKQPNNVLGASAWIANTNGSPWNGGHGDINIVLEVPEPASALLIAAPTLLALRRRR